MLCELRQFRLQRLRSTYVLILVLMEDALRGRRDPQQRHPRTVLILVLMEDALRVYRVRDRRDKQRLS